VERRSDADGSEGRDRLEKARALTKAGGFEPDASRFLGAPLSMRARREQFRLTRTRRGSCAQRGQRRFERPVSFGRTKRPAEEARIELSGARSNPQVGVEFARLGALHDELLRRALADPREPRPAPARASHVLETVTLVLERRASIHAFERCAVAFTNSRGTSGSAAVEPRFAY
jgi:hypothetical protein